MIHRAIHTIAGLAVPVYTLNTVIVGTGAAGLNCAVRLFREFEDRGVEHSEDQVALVTNGVGLGTSNNSGSDKQTYYKLGTHGAVGDTPREFAETLVAGGCTHGDVALAEAVNSMRGFMHLVDIGVPFPHDAFGAFVGYKTDHDPKRRGTSAGPWTSRFMVRRLLDELNRYNVPIFNRHRLLALVVDESHAAQGALCVDLERENDATHGLVFFNCRNIVAAGGGPGELYKAAVYPKGQMGPYGALFEAGAAAHNLSESQFGIASLEPRWNLSGTYQQVVPRYYSTDDAGEDRADFLANWFPSTESMATAIFLKGYQWPFDPDKTGGYGSSLIDILVQREIQHEGRRVFMDFRENPRAGYGCDRFDLDKLAPEARAYLERSGATQATPLERLLRMNPLSVELYANRGVDLARNPLEIGVCAQHCNGGFAVDAWWESTVRHLFVVGELAGTHGVKRPGGSALNSGQTGGLRAAQRIAHVYGHSPASLEDFRALAEPVTARILERILSVRNAPSDAPACGWLRGEIQARMSRHAGMSRSLEAIRGARDAARDEWQQIVSRGIQQQRGGYAAAFETRDIALTQRAFLEAIATVIERGGGSRGSYLVADEGGILPHPGLEDEWRGLPENIAHRDEIVNVVYDVATDSFSTFVERPRPIPEVEEAWFETAWAAFRAGTIFGDAKEGS